jgi:hypothetical protein
LSDHAFSGFSLSLGDSLTIHSTFLFDISIQTGIQRAFIPVFNVHSNLHFNLHSTCIQTGRPPALPWLQSPLFMDQNSAAFAASGAARDR